MIETIAKSDIFFMVTTVATILFTIIFLIIGFYLIGIVRNMRDISKTLKKSVARLDSNLEDMTEHVTSSPIFSFIFGKKRKNTKSK